MKYFTHASILYFLMLGFTLTIGTVNAQTSFSKQKDELSSSGLYSIKDHYELTIVQVPHSVQVCKKVTTNGDKTGDTLKGAILGGIIGNNIKGEKEGGTIGAIIGGMLGHANSNAQTGTKTVCSNETRYKETTKEIYSHSVITFISEGKRYYLKFIKWKISSTQKIIP